MDELFKSIFQNSTIGIKEVAIMVFFGILTGVIFSVMCYYKNNSSKSFYVAIALLPLVVSIVIMLVNGNIGAGVAVAGAFSLVRFRSAQGTAKEICMIFIAMALGLALGMGYVAYAIVFCIICGAALIICNRFNVFNKKIDHCQKLMKITIPEDLDYTAIFDDLFQEYTTSNELVRVKSTNMGSMFRLTFKITLRDVHQEKTFIDAIRCRNGNLEVLLEREDFASYEL